MLNLGHCSIDDDDEGLGDDDAPGLKRRAAGWRILNPVHARIHLAFAHF